jgi:hypothetical protein
MTGACLRVAYLVALGAGVALVAGCGGNEKGASRPDATSPSGGAASGPCGTPASPASCLARTASDLPDAFYAWPQMKRIFRNGRRFDVYTTLRDSQEATAVKICDTVFEDVAGQQHRPMIVTWSMDGTILATGAVAGTGCQAG